MSVAGIARRAGIDAAVFFALLTKSWQIVNALVTIVLIARYLTPETQGFFYTFGSLLGLQSFFELSFYLVIINVASHEWAHLQLTADGRIAGDPDALSRLVSLGRLSAKWYAIASLLFLLAVGSAGLWFFASTPAPNVTWRGPWIALVCATALMLVALPLNSILEGCNQVATLQRFRFYEVMVGSLALWGALVFGLSLWAAVFAALAPVARSVVLVAGRYRNFFTAFLQPPSGARLDWYEHIWPMQWRLAVSGVVSFLAFSIFNPVMFHYHGPIVAGQMGMTWAMTVGIQGIALAWISTRAPLFGQMIARRDWQALDALWWRVSIISVAVAATGAAAALALVYAFRALELPFAERLLPPLPTAIMLLGMVIMQISQCQSAYLRAHKQEPIAWMSFWCAMANGAGVWIFGARFGPIGAASAYLAVTILVITWETSIWRRCRKVWHV